MGTPVLVGNRGWFRCVVPGAFAGPWTPLPHHLPARIRFIVVQAVRAGKRWVRAHAKVRGETTSMRPSNEGQRSRRATVLGLRWVRSTVGPPHAEEEEDTEFLEGKITEPSACGAGR